ncbi:MAG: ATP-binding protein [Deltaproteobacteria bacterium]|nr:ATP-binding protein [Deltaproteobacteria bacterium]
MTAPFSIPSTWSEWDRFPGGLPRPRKELERLHRIWAQGEPVLLYGSRGVGKSTLLRQFAGRLQQEGLDRKRIRYLDLEDPIWAPRPDAQSIAQMIENKPGPPGLVLLDGLPPFGGSPPSGTEWGELASRLLGRGIRVLASQTAPPQGESPKGWRGMPLLPMGLSEWMKIFTDKSVDMGRIESTLRAYLFAGGLPVSRNFSGRRSVLLELFQRSLLLDVLMQKKVRDPEILTAVAVSLLGRTGQGVSASSLKGRLCRSIDQARMFLVHLQRAGLIFLVPRIADASRAVAQSSRLVFAADTGLAHALGVDDLEVLALNAVFLECLRLGLTVQHWSAKGRKGLFLKLMDNPGVLVDVQWPGPSGRADLRPIEQAMKERPEALGLFLMPGIESARLGGLARQDLGTWLINPRLDADTKIPTAKPVKKDNGIASHLL